MGNLLFCMSPGIGLGNWKAIGSLHRELRPYAEYARKGWRVKILSYDSTPLPDGYEGIEVVRFPHRRLLPLLPWLYRKLGHWADVVKTNQSIDAYFYTRAAKIWNKPIILRCGYVQGEYLETTEGLTRKTVAYQEREKCAFRDATHCFLPTVPLSAWVMEHYGIPADKITILPNFVDTDIFRPLSRATIPRSVVSVGRLAPVKQLDLLVRACAEVGGTTLTLVGDGPEKESLLRLARELGVNLRLPGNMPNEVLPEILREHEVFAVTSLREGHPKALLEALSCGMPCVGVDALGVSPLLADGRGIVVARNETALANAITAVFSSPDLAASLGTKAREHVCSVFGFSSLFATEYDKCLCLCRR